MKTGRKIMKKGRKGGRWWRRPPSMARKARKKMKGER